MTLDTFREPQTPESRTWRVVLVLTLLGAPFAFWRWVSGSVYAVEIAAGALVVALGWAVALYVRQRRA